MHKRLPTTEKRDPKSESIDERSTLEIVTLVNQEDKLAAQAVARLKAASVMHVRDVHLPEALEILKDNNELLRPAIAESIESA